MRSLITVLLGFLLASATLKAQESVPAVLKASARTRPGGEVLSQARLHAYLEVVVCKAPLRALNGSSDFYLYLDGNRSTPAAQPVILEDLRTDGQKQSASIECAKSSFALQSKAKALEARIASQAAEAAAKAAAGNASAQQDAVSKAVLERQANEKAASDEQSVILGYYLDPALVTNAATKAAWTQLLQKPWEPSAVAVSVGPSAGPWPSLAHIGLQRLNIAWLIVWIAFFVVANIVFLIYARKSDILRDSGPLPVGTAIGTRKSYSLGRTQMALWTFLVAGALVFLFIVCWNENTLTNGILILIGISSGTTLLAAVADGDSPSQPTKGFLKDLLSDGTNDSFHRFQMILFTMILGVIFVVKVCYGLAMPEFDPTLLGLMGISNGTYLGFKMQGK